MEYDNLYASDCSLYMDVSCIQITIEKQLGINNINTQIQNVLNLFPALVTQSKAYIVTVTHDIYLVMETEGLPLACVNS